MEKNKLKAAAAAIIFIVAAVTVFLSYHQGLWRFNYPSRETYPVHGLDVSHHQGEIDWQAVDRKKFSFVYIKATEGGDHKDSRFQENYRQARKNGMIVGAYHFFTLCRDGSEQSRNFVGAVKRAGDDLPPAIDLEFTGNCFARPGREEFHGELKEFVSTVERHFGVKPVLYTTGSFYRFYLKDSEFSSYPLWIRGVFTKPDASLFPGWTLWQYADNARINGIRGPVDLNVMTPSIDFLTEH